MPRPDRALKLTSIWWPLAWPFPTLSNVTLRWPITDQLVALSSSILPRVPHHVATETICVNGSLKCEPYNWLNHYYIIWCQSQTDTRDIKQSDNSREKCWLDRSGLADQWEVPSLIVSVVFRIGMACLEIKAVNFFSDNNKIWIIFVYFLFVFFSQEIFSLQYLVELSMLEADPFLKYLPSVTAAASLCLACQILDREHWVSATVFYSPPYICCHPVWQFVSGLYI